MCIITHTHTNTHTSADAYGGQRCCIPPELELQEVVSFPTWVLGTELGFFARMVCTLSCWATSLSLPPTILHALDKEIIFIDMRMRLKGLGRMWRHPHKEPCYATITSQPGEAREQRESWSWGVVK